MKSQPNMKNNVNFDLLGEKNKQGWAREKAQKVFCPLPIQARFTSSCSVKTLTVVVILSYAVVRMAKMKSHDLKGTQFHNQRERESKTNPDIDKEKTKDNYDLVNTENINYNERVKEIIEPQTLY